MVWSFKTYTDILSETTSYDTLTLHLPYKIRIYLDLALIKRLRNPFVIFMYFWPILERLTYVKLPIFSQLFSLRKESFGQKLGNF